MLPNLSGFDYRPRTRVVFGPGTVEQVGALAAEVSRNRKILLVTDPGIVAAGHSGRVQSSLEAAGLTVFIFDQVRENPTTRDVAACLDVAKAAGIDTLVGLGGGSSMDTAKGCNFILTNGGRMQDYWGVGKATKAMLPLIAVPTTAGTGSECQSFALIADEETHRKMACGDPKAAAYVALLDPQLTLSQPREVTACTGIDALAHALESAVTTRRNEISHLFAREAFVLAQGALPRVMESGEDLDARGRMQWAAALAGMAIENSMLGVAHSAANPLTSDYGIIHGRAVGIMLPAVIRFNAIEARARRIYVQFAEAAGWVRDGMDDEQIIMALVERVEGLLNIAGMPGSLAEMGVERDRIEELSEEAVGQWTAQFNPRPVTKADLARIYALTFEPRRVTASA